MSWAWSAQSEAKCIWDGKNKISDLTVNEQQSGIMTGASKDKESITIGSKGRSPKEINQDDPLARWCLMVSPPPPGVPSHDRAVI